MDVQRVGAELAISGTPAELQSVVSSANVMQRDIEIEAIRAGLDVDENDGPADTLAERVRNATIENGVYAASITVGMADLANRGARMALKEIAKLGSIFGPSGRQVMDPLHTRASGFREVAKKLGPVLKEIELERANGQ